MSSETFTILHGVGLHARPAAKFVKICKGFESAITLRNVTRGGDVVDAKSLVKVIKSAAAQNQQVEVSADGDDEAEAMAAIRVFLTEVPEDER